MLIFFFSRHEISFSQFPIIHDFFFLHVNGGMYYTDPVYYSPLYWFIPCRSNEDNFNLLEYVILGFLWYDISLLVNCAKIIFRIQMSLESDWLRIACYCLCINCFIKVKFFCKLTSKNNIKLTKKFNFISKNNIYFLFAHSCCNDL